MSQTATEEMTSAEGMAWKETAERHRRNEQYYRSLVEQIGNAIGAPSQIADDGSISEDVLCAKVPELVDKLVDALATACPFCGDTGYNKLGLKRHLEVVCTEFRSIVLSTATAG